MSLLILSFLFSVPQESFSDIDSACGMLFLHHLEETEEISPRIPHTIALKIKAGTQALNFASLFNIPNK